jgi:hypothetical protein
LQDLCGGRYQTIEPEIPLHGTAAMAAYAYDQIDQARTELKAISK